MARKEHVPALQFVPCGVPIEGRQLFIWPLRGPSERHLTRAAT